MSNQELINTIQLHIERDHPGFPANTQRLLDLAQHAIDVGGDAAELVQLEEQKHALLALLKPAPLNFRGGSTVHQ
jgi:hypothetical protein